LSRIGIIPLHKMMSFKKRKRVSLVLGGGGARGIAHIGVIQYLEEQGYEVDEIVGCSIGALVGGAYANKRLHELGEWMKTLTRGQVFKDRKSTRLNSSHVKI